MKSSSNIARSLQAGLGVVALVLASAPVASAAPQQASVLCTHPYFPVSETAEWHYRAGMPSLPILMGEDVVRQANLTETGFEQVRRVQDAGTLVQRWTCTPDGLSDMPREASVTADGAPTGTVQFTDANGTTLPLADRWQAGYSWTQGANGTFDGLDVVPGTNPRAQSAIAKTHTIVGRESVTVPAGTFSAWKIETRASGPVTVEIAGQKETFEVTTLIEAWYVENVGLVKSSSSLDEMVVDTMELLSFQL
jgi:hypothetical protein